MMENQGQIPARYRTVGQDSLGLRDIVSVVLRRRWIILSIVVPIFLMGLLSTMNSTSSVTAGTRVIVNVTGASNLTFRDPKIDYNVLMSSASQVALSLPVAQKAAFTLWDSLEAIYVASPEMIHIETVADLQDVLQMHSDCHQVGETNILELAVSHQSQKFAMLAVHALTEGFLDYSIEQRKNEPAVDYYTEQIQLVKSDIDNLMIDKTAVLDEYGLLAFAENATASAHQIVGMERVFFTTKAAHEARVVSYEAMVAACAADPLYLPRAEGSDLQMISVKGQLTKEETSLAKLRSEYHENSEWVQRQIGLLEEMNLLFAKERANYLNSISIALQASQKKLNEMNVALEEQRLLVSKYPAAQQRVLSIELSISSQRDLMEILQVKRGEVRLQAATDYRMSNLTYLNKASIIGDAGGGKMLIYLALAGFFGLALGLIAALFVDKQDHRLYNRNQLEEFLEVPVLGSVSKIGDSK